MSKQFGDSNKRSKKIYLEGQAEIFENYFTMRIPLTQIHIVILDMIITLPKNPIIPNHPQWDKSEAKGGFDRSTGE